jgi:2-polyprenyl-6-methoxyphenol hydroxylase-like FAD-dependent oxidoreductase
MGRQKKILADAFAGDGWEIPTMLENAAAARDFYFDSIALIEMDRWSKGRVVLLGDAAHCASPASGQGTGLALIGAYILAGELAAANGDHTVAYERYERGMRPGVELNQKFAEGFAKEMTIPSKGKIRLRMAMLRMLPYMPWKNLIARKITESVQEAAYAIGIKDYASREAPAAARRGTGR